MFAKYFMTCAIPSFAPSYEEVEEEPPKRLKQQSSQKRELGVGQNPYHTLPQPFENRVVVFIPQKVAVRSKTTKNH